MKYAVCIVPVAPVRLVADHREEMTSQYVFGESGKIKDSNEEGWIWLESINDRYTGWCRSNQFILSENEFPHNKKFTGEWVNDIFINSHLVRLPFAADLSILDISLPECKIEYSGKIIDAASTQFNENNIRKLSSMFSGTGYLWGGKTVFGVDCSGFVQSVFRLMDVHLLRDANQQVTQGDTIGFLEEARCGDLAFFDDESGIVVHVGILLNPQQIIHSSGNVRIDKIDNEGILNVDTGLRTHRLRTIKRVAMLS